MKKVKIIFTLFGAIIAMISPFLPFICGFFLMSTIISSIVGIGGGAYASQQENIENQVNMTGIISGFGSPSNKPVYIANSFSYGWFVPDFTVGRTQHNGLDVIPEQGSLALAPYDCEIVDITSGWGNYYPFWGDLPPISSLDWSVIPPLHGYQNKYLMPGGGNIVVMKIKHPDFPGKNIWVTYNHLNNVFVGEGQIVKKGEMVGTPGNSGLSSGTHFHIIVAVADENKQWSNITNDDLIDPLFAFWGIPGSENSPDFKDGKLHGIDIYKKEKEE